MKWEEANQKVRKEHVRICREKTAKAENMFSQINFHIKGSS